MRLSKLLKELNISIDRALDALMSYSNKSYNLNSKLTLDEIEYLESKFSIDKKIKLKMNHITEYGVNLDLKFEFQSNEKEEYNDLFNTYLKIEEDINQLKNKMNRYYSLELDEINILLKFKYGILYNIQNEIKFYRKHENRNEKKIRSFDPYENVSWGGLSGEEAYIGQWNCD